MMRWIMLCLIGSLWAGNPVVGAEPVEESPTAVAIVALGDIPKEYMERVRSFVEVNTSIATRLLEPQFASDECESFSDMLDSLAHLRTPDVACVVFLYAGDRDFEEHTVYRYESAVGVVNAALMMDDEEERYLRRLEKLTMRSVGFLMGVEMVPIPQSAMWTYRTMADLDAMGRNYDPPSLMRLHERARERGIPLIKHRPPLHIQSDE